MFNGNTQEVQNAIITVTQGRGSRNWIINNINALQAGLDTRNALDDLSHAVNL